MKNTNKLAFTLIELLVVITIIWILATWATSVYTSQIQKARDATRLQDIEAVKWGIEQFYQDNDQYPNSNNSWEFAFSWVTKYTPKLPQDPKSWQARNWAAFDYIYTVWEDDNNIAAQDYEISTTFEQQWNIDKKAKWDWGDDDVRLEMGIDLNANNSWNDTKVTWKITQQALKCVNTDWTNATCSEAWSKLLIRKYKP